MTAFLIALLVSLGQGAAPPAGTIRGRVVDRDTGRPLARALVHLSVQGSGELRAVTTDERGAFAFEALPPGRYDGFVSARQHAFESLRPGPITLARDDVVDVVVRVPPAFGIDVRIVDASGEPLSGIELQPIALDTGRAPFMASMHASDDLGHVRVFGLLAGRYVLCAGADSVRVPRTASQSRGDRLIRTCYPSNDEQSAEPVRIDRADLDGLEIRMRRGRTFTVAGTVLDAAGAPASSASVGFVRPTPNGSSSLLLSGDGSGRFRVDGVPPGAYGIQAGFSADGPRERRASEAAFVEVRVTDADIDDLVVSLRKTVDVEGRLVVEDGVSSLPAPMGSGFIIDARLAEIRLPGSDGALHAIARADRTFTLTSVFGSRVLSFFNVPRGWYVKSVRYGDREIIDMPVEFAGGRDAPRVDVIVANRGAVVNGTVSADDGTGARGSMVYLLRLAGPRGITIAAYARATAAGAFTLGPVRGGEYALVALPSTSDVQPNETQERFTRLVALGERVTLTDLDERSVPLRVVRER